MFYDIALQFDPKTFSCDLVLGADGDLAVDETPVTPMLLSVGLDARAAPDDELPQGRELYLAEHGIDVRRGSPCDALDGTGARIGSKCWLLDRAKDWEETRLLYQMWLEQALEWVGDETGRPAKITVTWVRPQTLQWRVMVDEVSLVSNHHVGSGGLD